MSCDNRPVEFERVIVARTLTTWLAAEGSVDVQIASPSSESLVLHAELKIGLLLSSVAVVPPAQQLHVHAVAATPHTPTEIAAARAENIAPLSRAFVNSTFTVEQQSAILD